MVTRLSAGCQAHICVYIIINERERDSERERARERESEREREIEREREREREREKDRIQKSKNPAKKIRQKKLPRQFSRLLTPAHLSRFFTGISRTARAMWCFVAYVYNGREREKERERRREREIERERERDRERETERVPCRIILLQWDENCITYVFTRQFSRVLTPGISSLGFSWESPAGNMSLMFIMGNLFPS